METAFCHARDSEGVGQSKRLFWAGGHVRETRCQRFSCAGVNRGGVWSTLSISLET